MNKEFSVNDRVVIKRNKKSYIALKEADHWRKKGKVLYILSIETDTVIIGDSFEKVRASKEVIRHASIMDYICYGLSTILRIK